MVRVSDERNKGLWGVERELRLGPSVCAGDTHDSSLQKYVKDPDQIINRI